MKRHLFAGAALVFALAAVCHAQVAEFAISYPDESEPTVGSVPIYIRIRARR